MNYIEMRKKAIRDVAKNPRLAEDYKELCRKRVTAFFNLFAWTIDPRRDVKIIPFILYPFQEEFVGWLEDRLHGRKHGLVEKSRDMGATWMGIVWIVYHWLFDAGFTAHIGSRKEDYVDRSGDMNTLFERMRFVLKKLPRWMLPKGFNFRKHTSHMRIINPENEAIITGESANDNFGRQARATVCWMALVDRLVQRYVGWMSLLSGNMMKKVGSLSHRYRTL
jgi:hypothetical protein